MQLKAWHVRSKCRPLAGSLWRVGYGGTISSALSTSSDPNAVVVDAMVCREVVDLCDYPIRRPSQQKSFGDD